ncbi:MAG: gamma-glutamyl-gamma-aminobutyrate hydrolase family protein [Myxococcales bacterium]|nr:gamma-glutamyl-gamma-aminobutyrate hydrolase family protein [Myxococcales bacterium]
MRIGLTQRVEVVASYGERRDCLDQEWTTLLEALELTPVPLANRLREPARAIEALGLDGIIFTGGNDLAFLPGATNAAPERDALEAAALDHCLARGLPALGVCRGMQRVVTHLGGALVEVTGHVATRHAISRIAAPTRRDVPAVDDRDAVNSFHNFGVREGELGPALEALALAPDGTVEALAHRDAPLLAVMWHPERDPRDPRDRALISALFSRQGPHR